MTIQGKDLERLLSEDRVISLIIREVSAIDDFLNLLIARYFSIRKRERLFMDLVTSRLSYSAKIDLLRRCEYSRDHKSLRVFSELERLAFLRNIVAHRFDAMFGRRGIDRLEKRPDVIALLDEFPNYIKVVIQEAWKDLFRLSSTNDMQWNVRNKKQ